MKRIMVDGMTDYSRCARSKMNQVEAELWALNKRLSKIGQDIDGWKLFDVVQFASAYAYYNLYFWLLEHSYQEYAQLLAIVRLADIKKDDLAEMGKVDKKLKRRACYLAARKALESTF